MDLPLILRLGKSRVRQTCGWLIPGRHPEAWCDELVRWQIPHDRVKLYVVPRSRGDVTPRGVLVVVQHDRQPQPSPRCQEYGLAGQRLYLPVEATLDPDVTDAELDRLLVLPERLYLFHPAAGMVSYESTDVLSVAEILTFPPPRETVWTAAQPDLHFNSRLYSVEPIVNRTIDHVMDEARGDIGEKEDQLNELSSKPALPPVSRPGALGHVIEDAIAGLKSLFSQITATWISAGEAAVGQPRQSASRREMARKLRSLLDLLGSNPDQGLRYAPPFGDGSAARGVRPSSGQLHEHSIEFTGQRAGGGGPAEQWYVPHDLYLRLQTKYRELAQREIALGRHRRAAYIFASLLGDWESAAQTLRDGQHCRDAALVYREKLGRLRAAAECLEEGGLLSEAIVVWKEVGDLEHVGDLYLRLGEPAEAEVAFRQLVSHRLAKRDHLSAAKLLRDKIHAPQEALEVLDAAWAAGVQSAECLRESFNIRQALQDHQGAQHAIKQLAPEHLNTTQLIIATDVLSEVAGRFRETSVHNLASDMTRRLVACYLQAGCHNELDRVIGNLRRLVPDESLLARDCSRFVSQARLSRRRTVSTRRSPHRVEFIDVFLVSSDVTWIDAFAQGSFFYAMGHSLDNDRDVRVLRSDWKGNTQVCRPTPAPSHVRTGFVFARSDPIEGELWLLAIGHPPFEPTTMAATDYLPRTVVRTPEWLPSGTVALTRASSGEHWCVAEAMGQLYLNAYVGGHLIRSQSLGKAEHQGSISLAVVGDVVLISGDAGIVVWRDNLPPDFVPYDRRVTGVQVCPMNGHRTLLISLERGARLLDARPWVESRERHSSGIPFAQELAEPQVCYVPGGWIVAVSRDRGVVYRVPSNGDITRWALLAKQPWSASIKVMPTGRRDEFAILCEQGSVFRYQIRRTEL